MQKFMSDDSTWTMNRKNALNFTKKTWKAAAIKRTSQRCSRQCLYSSLPLKHREEVFLAVNVKKWLQKWWLWGQQTFVKRPPRGKRPTDLIVWKQIRVTHHWCWKRLENRHQIHTNANFQHFWKPLATILRKRNHGLFGGEEMDGFFLGITMASNHPGIIPYMQAIPVMAWAIATLVLPLTETNSGALDAQVRIVICQIWVRMREWEWFTHCHDDYIYIYIQKNRASDLKTGTPSTHQLFRSPVPLPGSATPSRNSHLFT